MATPVAWQMFKWSLLGPGSHRRFVFAVECGWCCRTVLRESSACLMCAPKAKVMEALLADPEFAGLLRAARATPDNKLPRLVLSDWLDERGLGELADLFRKTL